jgi:DNA-binding response OmpR family regulator
MWWCLKWMVWKLVKTLKRTNKIIITFLTARSEDYSLLDRCWSRWLYFKADKTQAISKVKALLRRLKERRKQWNAKCRGIEINHEEYKIVKTILKSHFLGKSLNYFILASKPGKVFKRMKLDKVWKRSSSGGRTIDVHIRKSEKKLRRFFQNH